MARGFVIAWEFQVRQGGEDKFRAAYSPQGEWVALYRKAQGFVRTELVRSEYDSLKFITVDVWESREAYNTFRQKFAEEYDALDTLTKDLALHETKFGSFYLE